MASDTSSQNTKILTLFKPTIQLEQIAIKDVESDSQKYAVSDDSVKPSKSVGHFSPYIKVNGFVFDHHEISDMTIKEEGFLPTIVATIRDTKGVFKSAYFPKTKPVLSLYIRSKHDKLKCVRCDFLITNIMTDSSSDHENRHRGKNMEMTFTGILFVPQIYSNAPLSYANLTSYEVLQELAMDMQLGFASNENYTNDRMTWLKPLIAKSNFIQHVLVRSFKDDDSFYMGFVDKYYNLNFINMSQMFNETGDLDKVFDRELTYADLYTKQSDNVQTNDTADLVLTNYSKMSQSDTFIQEYRPETSQGGQLIRSGYVRSISYYDQQLTKSPKDNLITLDVRPKSTSLIPGGGDSTENNLNVLASNLSYGEWCGIDYNNGHDNFNYAQIQNEHNNQEIRKITLHVKMKGVNLNIIRGMRVPVLILVENAGDVSDAKSFVPESEEPKQDTEESKDVQIIKDKWLSGYYVVGDLTYNYDMMEGFSTEATLLRMNWKESEAEMPN